MATNVDKKVFIAVLAAGRSQRFGSSKQLAAFEGQALVKRALDLACDVTDGRCALILGHEWQAVRDACKPQAGFMVLNDDYATGMGTSIASAVRALRHAADAILFVLVDQPFITAAHLQGIIARWSGAEHHIVATGFSATHGPPVLLPSGCFDDLEALCDERGAKELLDDERFELTVVDFAGAAHDIDTPEDLAKARSAKSL